MEFNDSVQNPEVGVAHIWPLYNRINQDGLGGSETSPYTYPDLTGRTDTGHHIESKIDLLFNNSPQTVINSFIVIICLLGLVGNGMVIWLYGFCIKRNPFTTYILNLSIADFGVLLCLICASTFVVIVNLYSEIYSFIEIFLVFLELFFFTYSTSQFLLAAISIDRCVAVFFPLWHRCHRPPALSTIVCALIWILSFVLSAIDFTLHKTLRSERPPLLYQLTVNVLIGTPLMVISTLTLFIRVWWKSQKHQRRKLVTAILLALLFFLIFAVPLNLFYIINHFHASLPSLMVTGFACASLNSSINPLIYYLVGRKQKKGQPRASMKVALQRVFKDEQDTQEKQKPHG